MENIQESITIYHKASDSYKEYPAGIRVSEIMKDLNPPNKELIVAAKINFKSEDLNFALYKPKYIDFIRITSSSGMRVYVRTLSIVLSKAIEELFPGSQFFIEHPLSKGYFCQVRNLEGGLRETDIKLIKEKMLTIIAQNIPIIKRERQTENVIRLFRERKQMDKVLLLEGLNKPFAEYYELDGFFDYYYGALLPSTGYLNLFDLLPLDDGFLLRIPSRSNPCVLEDYVPQPKMHEIFKEYIQWNNQMGMDNVGEFNKICRDRKVQDLIKVVEALHEKKIAGIADQIASSREQKKFVMVSGPSSSGKTTFSKRLSVQLQVLGIEPIVLSLDNYFVDREKTPLDEHGEYDFEALGALDIDFFNEQLKEMLEGKEVHLPVFNFETGKRMFKGDKIQLKENNILLMEGIHALNPALTPAISDNNKFNIYVSALTTISLDNHNWIPTTDNRLIRRIIRDHRYRGYSAQQTISRWPSVRKGEDKWIFPFQENADVMFNSALIFEFAALKRYIDPILAEVPKNSEEYSEAHRLRKFLKYFHPIFDREIPPTSLLREFVGGSSFRY